MARTMMRRGSWAIAMLLVWVAACSVMEPTLQGPDDLAIEPDVVPSGVCPACVVGPLEYVRLTSVPETHTVNFAADPLADYIIDLDDLGTQGADGSVTVNGVVILAPRTVIETGPRHVRKAITLAASNTMTLRITGKPGSKFRVMILGGAEVVGTGGGSVRVPGGGVILDIPAGALSGPTEILIAPVALEALQDAATRASAFSKLTVVRAFDAKPDGLQFSIPVVATFAGVAPQGNAAPALATLEDGDLVIEPGPVTYDPNTQVLAATIHHFSTNLVSFMEAGWTDLPSCAYKKEGGQTVYEDVTYNGKTYRMPVPDKITTLSLGHDELGGGNLPAGCGLTTYFLETTLETCAPPNNKSFDLQITAQGTCGPGFALYPRIDPDSVGLLIGESAQFGWRIEASSGDRWSLAELLKNSKFPAGVEIGGAIWVSDNPTVASFLNNFGLVRGNSDGTVDVAACGSLDTPCDEAKVFVYPKLHLEFDDDDLTVPAGSFRLTTARLLTEAGDPYLLSESRPPETAPQYTILSTESPGPIANVTLTDELAGGGSVKVQVQGDHPGTASVRVCVPLTATGRICGTLPVTVIPARPEITSVTPSEIIIPDEGTTEETITVTGRGFQDGQLYTTAWIVLEGESQVSADGTTISRTYKVGPGAVPGDYKMIVVTPRGTAEYPITQREATVLPFKVSDAVGTLPWGSDGRGNQLSCKVTVSLDNKEGAVPARATSVNWKLIWTGNRQTIASGSQAWGLTLAAGEAGLLPLDLRSDQLATKEPVEVLVTVAVEREGAPSLVRTAKGQCVPPEIRFSVWERTGSGIHKPLAKTADTYVVYGDGRHSQSTDNRGYSRPGPVELEGVFTADGGALVYPKAPIDLGIENGSPSLVPVYRQGATGNRSAFFYNRYFGYNEQGDDSGWFYVLTGQAMDGGGVNERCALYATTWCDGRIFDHNVSLFPLPREVVLGLDPAPLLVNIRWRRVPYITATATLLSKAVDERWPGGPLAARCQVSWTVHIAPHDYGQVYARNSWGTVIGTGTTDVVLDGVPVPSGASDDDLVPINDGSIITAITGASEGQTNLRTMPGYSFRSPLDRGLVRTQFFFPNPCTV